MGKISNLMNIEFDREPAYGDNDKYIKTIIKMCEDRVNTNFQGKKMPKENASYMCLLLIVLDCVARVNRKYYPQTLLEECKHVIRKNKMANLCFNNNNDNKILMYDPVLDIHFRILSSLLLKQSYLLSLSEALIKNFFVMAILKCTFITM